MVSLVLLFFSQITQFYADKLSYFITLVTLVTLVTPNFYRSISGIIKSSDPPIATRSAILNPLAI
jgi:hypothetical protein